MGFSFSDLIRHIINKKSEKNIIVEKQEKEQTKNTNFLSLNFDKNNFQKVFCEQFVNGNNPVEKSIEIALKMTLSKGLKEYNVNFTHLNFSLFAINTYKMGKVCSYKDLIIKGFYITNIRGNFSNEEKVPFEGIKIQSDFFTQYSDMYPFIKIKMTPKLTKCKFEITNALLSADLFLDLFEIKNCKCENLQFFDHYSELPLMFICPICGKLYMCDCQKKYYEIIHHNNKQMFSSSFFEGYEWHYPGSNPSTDFEYFYRQASYKPNICFICNDTVPPEVYSYSEITTFGKRYEPYIQALIDSQYDGNRYNTDFSLKSDYDTYKQKRKEAENIIRKKTGYPLIGEKWINETTLYKLCCILFSEYKVIREYSPEWLKPQRLDIAIPDLNLGIEYQGKQHFEPIELFGGRKGLKATKKRDEKKALLCKQNGLNLIYFCYDEEITEEAVTRKLKKFL